jgi:hypothetical protein
MLILILFSGVEQMSKVQNQKEPLLFFVNENSPGILYFASEINLPHAVSQSLFKKSFNFWKVTKEYDPGVKRMVLKNRDELITGIPNADNLSTLSDIQLDYFEIGETQSYLISRNIILSQKTKEEVKYARPVKQIENSENKLYKEKLEAYFQNEKREGLACSYKPGDKVVFLRLDDNLVCIIPQDPTGNNWAPQVKISVGNDYKRHPEDDTPAHDVFIASARHNYDPKDCICWLVKEQKGNIAASFKFGYFDVDTIIEAINIELKLNELILLPQKWYYAGVELQNPLSDGKYYHEPHHRFEFGFGKNILIPASRIRFNGEENMKSDFIFYTGDAVTEIEFLQNQQDSDTRLVLNIKNTSIEYSERTTLYMQSQNFKVIHLLYVVQEGQNVLIKSVRGFDEAEISGKASSRVFNRIDARLDNASISYLKARFADLEAFQKKELTIMGRMDTSLFRQTGELEFGYVKFSFDPIDEVDDSCLKNGDRVFMLLDEIVDINVDYKVTLEPIARLAQIDLGEDVFNKDFKLSILRRKFSIRENLLSLLYKNNPGEFKGYEVLVQIFRNGNRSSSRNRPFACLFDPVNPYSPVRRTALLKDLIASRKERLIAIVIRHEQSDFENLLIEMQPGIFFKIARRYFKTINDRVFRRWDTIMIEWKKEAEGNGYFLISEACMGDDRFVDQNGRPIVALPKNLILSRRELDRKTITDQSLLSLFYNNNLFTVADLPFIEGELIHRNQDNNQSFLKRIKTIMTNSNLKLSILTRHLQEEGAEPRYLIEPTQSILAGNLEINPTTLIISYIPNGSKNKEDKFELNWETVGYRFAAASDILKDLQEYQWQYHDRESGSWEIDAGGNINVTSVKLTGLSVLVNPKFKNGIVFLLRTPDGGMTLRYPVGQILRYGYPVQVLINWLAGLKNRTGEVTFVRSENGKYWVEIVPGRITEMPINLIKFKENNLLARIFDWRKLKCGDRIMLSLQASRQLETDQLVLLSWQPSMTNFFSLEQKVFMPIENADHITGALVLKAGVFTVTIPYLPAQESSDSWMKVNFAQISESELLEEIPELKAGDIVFITTGSSGEISLLGDDKKQCVPSIQFPEVWEQDPLRHLIIHERNGRLSNAHSLPSLINACGGALPVRVQNVGPDGKIYYSRQKLFNAEILPAGKASIAFIVGALNADFTKLLLRCGNELFVLPWNEIIWGVEPSSIQDAYTVLQEIPLWIHKSTDGVIRTGILEDDVQVLTCPEKVMQFIKTVSKDADNSLGIICRCVNTMRLYWMPKNEITWTSFQSWMAKILFRVTDEYFIAKLYRSKKESMIEYTCVSRIKTADSDKVFNKLRIGVDDISIIPVKQDKLSQNGMLYVCSNVYKMVFECMVQAEDQPFFTKQESAVIAEVSEKYFDLPRRLIVSFGRKDYKPDLPSQFAIRLEEYRNQTALLRRICEKGGLPEDFLEGMDNQDPDYRYRKEIIITGLVYHSLKKRTFDISLFINLYEEFRATNISLTKRYFPVLLLQLVIFSHVSSPRQKEEIINAFGFSNEQYKDFQSGLERTINYAMDYICVKALRSVHWEVIASEVLGDMKRSAASSYYYQKIDKIKEWLLADRPLKYAEYNYIKQFCIRVLSSTDDIAVKRKVTAIKIVLGIISDPVILMDNKSIAGTLIKTGRMRNVKFWKFRTFDLVKNTFRDDFVKQVLSEERIFIWNDENIEWATV